MDRLGVLDMENVTVVGDDKSKGSKISKGSRIGSPPRKRLADISNLQQPTKPLNQDAKSQQTILHATKEYVDKLHKENMTLMKVLAERNKVIELSGIELQKLRINLQKVQQQNLQLAQANSQMLAELNSGKDRLKALHHELGCKNGLLKARKFVLEDKAKKVTCLTSGKQVEADNCDGAGKANEEDNKPCNTNRRRQSKNSSLGSSTTKSVQAKEKIDNKRLCLRRQSARFISDEAEPTEDRLCSGRQSARFKCEDPEPTEDRFSLRRQSARFKSEVPKPPEDLFEIDDAKFPVSPPHDELVLETGPTFSDLTVSKEHKEGNSAQKDEARESRRRSSLRPLRQAVERVQSYKEIPINVKMRRAE